MNRMRESIIGCIFGTAVGDAMGLPMEGLTKRRSKKMYPKLDRYRFFFGRGMVSDDTEHTCMVAKSLAASLGDVEQFSRSLSRQLRIWLLRLPAGTGMATAKAILRLCIGFSPERSGVFSAGNGPAMRSAIIGVCYGSDYEKMRELVHASTRITHTDPKAEWGSLAVALAAYYASKGQYSPDVYLEELTGLLGEEASELLALAHKAIQSASAKENTETFAEAIGCGKAVSGYIYHTVPVVLHAWFRYGNDYQTAIQEVIRCGGDTDTTAAILGGIIGAGIGKSGIPKKWLDGLMEPTLNASSMELLGERLGDAMEQNKLVQTPFCYQVYLRNLFFLVIVLLHGFRRLLPPY